jgi:hypothetical protein
LESLHVLLLSGTTALEDLDRSEWLGINPWSDRETDLHRLAAFLSSAD